jgi:hypothetical protein
MRGVDKRHISAAEIFAPLTQKSTHLRGMWEQVTIFIKIYHISGASGIVQRSETKITCPRL